LKGVTVEARDLGVEYTRLDRRFEFVDRRLHCDSADDTRRKWDAVKVYAKREK